ncbi:MAG: GxxExxY protein [Candidatus Margulisiibacteriota bacterium]
MKYIVLTEKEEKIGQGIVNSAYIVHKRLGPGLLESIYEACFCYELKRAGLKIKRQAPLPIIYDGNVFNEGFRLDVLVEDLVICELKAVETIHPVFEAQLLSYLKLTKKRLGFLINFNVPVIRKGIKRMIHGA